GYVGLLRGLPLEDDLAGVVALGDHARELPLVDHQQGSDPSAGHRLDGLVDGRARGHRPHLRALVLEHRRDRDHQHQWPSLDSSGRSFSPYDTRAADFKPYGAAPPGTRPWRCGRGPWQNIAGPALAISPRRPACHVAFLRDTSPSDSGPPRCMRVSSMT